MYDRFVENLVGTRRASLPALCRISDSFMDGLENPAYATEFSAPEGRAFLFPSFRGSQISAASVYFLPILVNRWITVSLHRRLFSLR